MKHDSAQTQEQSKKNGLPRFFSFFYCNEKNPCSPNGIFPTDHPHKRDICETFDRTHLTARNVNYYSSLTQDTFPKASLKCVKSIYNIFALNAELKTDHQVHWDSFVVQYPVPVIHLLVARNISHNLNPI